MDDVTTRAEIAVAEIIADIEDRSTLGNEWEAIDRETRNEIRALWVKMACYAFKRTPAESSSP